MNRRSFFQAVIAALFLPKPAAKTDLPSLLAKHGRVSYSPSDWPNGKGDVEYDFMSPLLLNSNTSYRWDLRNS